MGSQEDDNSYKGILKGMTLFGGVQVFQILVNLARGKFVALFLGPEGMGISSLFTSSANTLSRASSLGLNLAIVKETAQHRDDKEFLPALFALVGRLLHLTALAGCLLTVLLSGVLSRMTFGSDGYAWQFMLLSLAVYFSVSGAGKLSLLQGLHEVKRVAGASLVGAVTGLVAGVPLYYFFREKGIVPAIVILALTTYLFYSVSLRKVVRAPLPKIRMSDHKPLIRRLVSLGVVLLAGDLIGSATMYAIGVYLRSCGDLDTVGLFQAANSLTNQYSGMVFTAMSLDYFPRLAAHIDDAPVMNRIVSRQMEVVAIVMAPIACIVIATAPLIIHLLLTDSFLRIVPLMRWMGLGIMIKALHYPMGYIAFAKNNRRLFFRMEAVAGNAILLGCIILSYRLFGFIGLGYAFVFDNALFLIMYYVVNHRVYGYTAGRKTFVRGSVALLLALVCFLCSELPSATAAACGMTVAVVSSVAFSAVEIRKIFRG